MRITIEISEVSCRRCGETAPLEPQFLRPRTARSAYSPAHTGTDDRGGEWDVTAEKPKGWAQLLNDPTAVLCPSCTAGVNAVVAAYMQLPQPEQPRGSTIPQLASPPVVPRSPIPVTVSSAPPPSSIPISAAPAPVVSTQRVQSAAASPAPIPARADEPARSSGAMPLSAPVLPTAPIPHAAGK